MRTYCYAVRYTKVERNSDILMVCNLTVGLKVFTVPVDLNLQIMPAPLTNPRAALSDIIAMNDKTAGYFDCPPNTGS